MIVQAIVVAVLLLIFGVVCYQRGYRAGHSDTCRDAGILTGNAARQFKEKMEQNNRTTNTKESKDVDAPSSWFAKCVGCEGRHQDSKCVCRDKCPRYADEYENGEYIGGEAK